VTVAVLFPNLELGEIAELYDSLHQTPQYSAEGYPMIRVTDIRRGFVNTAGAVRVDQETYLQFSKKHRPQVGDILFSRVGSYGNSAYVNRDEEFCLGQNTVCISPKKSEIEPTFLYCALNSDDLRSQIESLVGGASQGTISLKSIRKLKVPLPPLPVQRQIAGILSAYDELIENNQRRIKILEEMARSLYREWFVHFRFPGHDKVKMVPCSLAPIPQGWAVKRLDEISENFDRLRKPLSKMERAEMQGEYPYYGAAKVFDYVNDYIFDGEYLLMAEDGSVITPERAPVLQLANEKFWPNNHTHVLRGKDSISTHFLYLGLSLVDISPYITGAAQPKITQENMNRIPFLCGPADLHKRFDRLVDPIICGCQVLHRKIANLRRTRDLLLPRLLSDGLVL
jgi:type I restriction enzyme S subunit